jgi:hypothetical protein
MPSRASTILGAFEKAQAELVGKAVVLADASFRIFWRRPGLLDRLS